MSVIPFLPGLFCASKACNATCSKVPIIEYVKENEEVLKERAVYIRGSEQYDEIIKDFSGYNIKTELQPFFDRIEMRKDLVIIEKIDPSLGSAAGSNSFIISDIIIFVSPNLCDVDKEACHWVIKHEAGHIKNNDHVTRNLVPAICSTAAAILFKAFSMPIVRALCFTTGVAVVTHYIFLQYSEGKADDLAIKESSPQELKAARRVFMSLKASNLENRNTIRKKISISPDGEDRFRFSHPSHRSRLKKVESALREQNIKIDDQEESEKIKKLTAFINEADNRKTKDQKKGHTEVS